MALLTIQDMHRIIEQKIQKMGFFAYDDLESEEIDLKINEQIYNFVEAVVDITQGRKPNKTIINEGFQEDQVNLDSLRTLHVKDESRSLSSFSEGKRFTLPENYLHHIKTKLTISYNCVENKQTVTKTVTPKPSLRVVASQDIDNMKLSHFYKSKKDSPLGEIVGNYIYVHENNFTVTEAFLDYVTKPAKVLFAKDGNGDYDSNASIHCNLPDNVHYMIVNMTAIEIMKVIETQQQKIVNLQN